MTQNQDKYYLKEVQMVVKVDKSQEFVKSGKKLISEYPVISVKSSKLKKYE